MNTDIKSWLLRTKTFLSRSAFYIKYYLRRLGTAFKRRAPSLKRLHLDSFPAIHIKPMDWMDFILKFSGELVVVVLTIMVAGLNLFYFSGSKAQNLSDQSLAGSFVNYHSGLNQKFYNKNNTIATVVSGQGGFVQTALADDFSGLSPLQEVSAQSNDAFTTLTDEGLEAPSPDSIQNAVASVVTNYVTEEGDTLASVAKKFGVSQNTIRWSNPALASDSLKPGWHLLIPPVDGVVVIADSNTTLPDLAIKYSPERYNSNKTVRDQSAEQLLQKIMMFNALASAEDVDGGQIITIPGGVVTQAPAPVVPKPSSVKPKSSSGDAGINNVTSVGSGYDGLTHTFPKGYCTYYVAKRWIENGNVISFGGNAKNWLANARASGYVTGQEPAARAAVVMTGNASRSMRLYGHVAYVESVNDDGTITISEMNYVGFNKISRRTIPAHGGGIIGYIYP